MTPGPYIVTTKRPVELPGDSILDTPQFARVSRVAVAVLENRAALIDAGVPPFSEALDAVQAGETRVEARNGTVIEVEPTTTRRLYSEARYQGEWDESDVQKACDAFNVQEAKRA